jgi:AcrR family transcriptional regulator
MTTPARKRGRPRAYDPEIALKQAQDTFWRSGYSATSLDDLAAAMSMNRPSLYAAFGDKQALYLRAVERYAERSRRALAQELAASRPLRERLNAIYSSAIDFYLRGGRAAPRGCFLVGTALTEALPNRRIRAVMERTFEAFTDLFEQAFRAADRELRANADPRGLAQIATATLNTLSLRARTGAARTTLEALATASADAICQASRRRE